MCIVVVAQMGGDAKLKILTFLSYFCTLNKLLAFMCFSAMLQSNAIVLHV